LRHKNPTRQWKQELNITKSQLLFTL
jgi:hypothetical protein